MTGLIDFSSDAPAILVEGRNQVVSYRELGERVMRVRETLSRLPRPALAFIFAPNSPSWVACYCACLAEGIPLGLGDPVTTVRNKVIASYRPTALFLPQGAIDLPVGYRRAGDSAGLDLWLRQDETFETVPHSDLALLLATSGSTGDAKFVRLSRRNLVENARSIAEYLRLGTSEIAAQSLPLHYSYGLSVLNSHMITGGAVMLTSHSFIRPEFWRALEEGGCTSFAGVPYMYETLQRLRISPTERKSLKTITQAGGHLKADLVRHYHAAARKNNARFYVMYGQTEATARIAYVPPDRLEEKAGSIGVAIPRGELWLEPIEGDPAAKQLYYRGPNVMLGYATAPVDLVRGDELAGVLATGDLAEVDEDGFMRITGRLTRFAKLFGKRINLAAVESEVETASQARAMALDGGEFLRIYMEGAEPEMLLHVRGHLARWLGVPPVAFKMEKIDQLPLTASGKKDYKALR